LRPGMRKPLHIKPVVRLFTLDIVLIVVCIPTYLGHCQFA